MGYFDADAEEMLEVYLLEARQLTEQLNAVVLEAEKNNAFSETDIHSVFRVMHTIKSSSAMMGLKGLASLAHSVEDLFSHYREKSGKLDQADPELFDLLFSVSDFIESETEQMDQRDYAPGDPEKLEGAARRLLERISSGDKAEQEAGPAAAEKPRMPQEWDELPGVVVQIRFEEGCRMENIRAFMLVRQISGLCGAVDTIPRDLERSQESSAVIGSQGLLLRFESGRKDEVLAVLQGGLFVQSCQVLRDRPLMSEKPSEKRSPSGSGDSRESEFLSVRSDRLDRLQNLAREMMIQMQSLENQLDKCRAVDVKEGPAHQMNRLIGEMERTVMEMRMVSMEKIVPKLRRAIRDISRNEGKEIEFEASCGDIEADKSVVEYVSEALLHLIRNAVDHGIEMPEERAAAGKDKKGHIVFSVESAVGEVLISISDDGRGLDADKILKKAREMGSLVKPESEYTRQELLEMVLQPGFTTKEEVTEYSGRGVGLDVVKSVLERAGGNLYIESEPGRGTTFTLVVPLTLATMECTRFGVGKYHFSVPARYVFRFLDYRNNLCNIQEINGGMYILYEDRMVPLIDLRRFYNLPGEGPEAGMLIYVRETEKEGCILADAMYEQKRIVVKQLPELFGVDFRRRTGISGLSIMGSGKICTALDLGVLFGLYERESIWK